MDNGQSGQDVYWPQICETLDDDPEVMQVRAYLPPFIAEEAVFERWTEAARDNAAENMGVDLPLARLAFDKGAYDMVDCWIQHIDALMIREFPQERIDGMKIRARIHDMVAFRLKTYDQNREAWSLALDVMAMPQYATSTAKITWRTADLIWRMAGDTATDYNHYSKRTILSAVYGSTLMAYKNADLDDALAFLGRRIDNVMQFEKAKAKFLKNRPEKLSLSRFLGHLRYPSKRDFRP